MDILENVIAINIQYYFILMKNVRECSIELDVILCEKAIFQRFIVIDIRKSNDDLLLDDNADDDLTLGTAWNIHNIVIPVKSVFDKNFSHYCYRVLRKNIYVNTL